MIWKVVKKATSFQTSTKLIFPYLMSEVSAAIGSYYQALESKQEQWQYPAMFVANN